MAHEPKDHKTILEADVLLYAVSDSPEGIIYAIKRMGPGLTEHYIGTTLTLESAGKRARVLAGTEHRIFIFPKPNDPTYYEPFTFAD